MVKWPSKVSCTLAGNVIALQTSRLLPLLPSISKRSDSTTTNDKLSIQNREKKVGDVCFGGFNLGLHVGDNVETVLENRHKLIDLINQKLANQSKKVTKAEEAKINIQWLTQVHGNEVVTITHVTKEPLIADASITRQKNIALAIMTADCLPILLSHKEGNEIAAIHGGWRPLSGNIIANTIDKMHSNPSELVAWLGPCIGKNAFEVGEEVREVFIQFDSLFNNAFVKQSNGKYLADLHQIARRQLTLLGVTDISSLEECTYQNTNKYYSYRKNQITGRMASLICKR